MTHTTLVFLFQDQLILLYLTVENLNNDTIKITIYRPGKGERDKSFQFAVMPDTAVHLAKLSTP